MSGAIVYKLFTSVALDLVLSRPSSTGAPSAPTASDGQMVPDTFFFPLPSGGQVGGAFIMPSNQERLSTPLFCFPWLLPLQFDLPADEFASWSERLVIHGLVRRNLLERANNVLSLCTGYSRCDGVFVLAEDERRIAWSPNSNEMIWYWKSSRSRNPDSPSPCAIDIDLPLVIRFGSDEFGLPATKVMYIACHVDNLSVGDRGS